MNVIVLIAGREAIPVRAIPLLTYWRFLSPDEVAHLLGDTGGCNANLFNKLQSHQMEDGKVKPVKKDYFAEFVHRNLQALSEKIMATQVSHEAGYAEWRKQSLGELPAGVFVWKDEYQKMHDDAWDNRSRMFTNALLGWNTDGERDESDEEIAPQMLRNLTREDLVDDSRLKRTLRESLQEMKDWEKPDYSPFIQPELQNIVMEGFLPTPDAGFPEVDSLFQAIEKNDADITYWRARTDDTASDAAIKQAKLEPLEAERTKLGLRKKALRGDDITSPIQLEATIVTSEKLVGASGTVAHIPKQHAQENRVLELLTLQGYNPQALPTRQPGKSGAKATIRLLALKETALFTIKTFDTAWQRLRGDGRIAG